MDNWVFTVIEQYGYLGVFIIIVIENVFPPLPSEIVLTFSGFMTTQTDLTVSGIVISSTMGSMLGATTLYVIGRAMDIEKLDSVIERWGKYIKLTKDDVRKADAWFDRYGVWPVFFCRLIPFFRSIISIPAGMTNMRYRTFILFTTLGTLCWNSLLVMVGKQLGSRWTEILTYTELYSSTIYIIIGIVILLLCSYYLFRYKKLN